MTIWFSKRCIFNKLFTISISLHGNQITQWIKDLANLEENFITNIPMKCYQIFLSDLGEDVFGEKNADRCYLVVMATIVLNELDFSITGRGPDKEHLY